MMGGFVMRMALLFAGIISLGLGSAPGNRILSFEERIRAQEAVERVYYSHRIWPKENPGPKPPFEEMISKAQVEAKVEDYLKKSALSGFRNENISKNPVLTIL